MVPSSVATLIGFVLFALPGVLFELLRERHQPARERTVFRETSTVALTSSAFSGAAAAALALVRARRPEWMPDPRLLFARHSVYFAQHYRLVLRALVIEVLGACALSVVVYRLGPRSWRQTMERPFALTWSVLHESTASKRVVPHVILRTPDGTTYKGDVSNVEAVGPLADRQIALAAPVVVTRPDGAAIHIERPWERLVLGFSSIEEMYVSFADPKPRRWAWRAGVGLGRRLTRARRRVPDPVVRAWRWLRDRDSAGITLRRARR